MHPLPKLSGFRQLVLSELYSAFLADNFWVRKRSAALVEQLWWTGYPEIYWPFVMHMMCVRGENPLQQNLKVC